MKRVVITGAGTINPLGHSVAETYAAMQAGRCAIKPLDIRDAARLSCTVGAQVADWDPDACFDRKQVGVLDRFAQFALFAAREAVAQSGLVFDERLACASGAILGTAGGGLTTMDDNYRMVYEEGKNRVHPFTVPRLMASAAASHLSMEFGLFGPTFAVSTACASSNHAMGLAFHLIRGGGATALLTGGSEAMLCFGGIKAWEGLRVMATEACRPFSLERNGMVQGEGAAVFVFEERNHALARGADILAEVIGFGMSADAQNIIVPSQTGAERAMRTALGDARLNPSDVGYLNAHGTGTKVNDKTECAAISAVFGAAARSVMVSSTKAMHGHLIGGTGAVELLACVMALRHGIIAPTVGYQTPDPDCALDVVPNVARQAKISVALSNAFAFGGLNAVLVLRAA